MISGTRHEGGRWPRLRRALLWMVTLLLALVAVAAGWDRYASYQAGRRYPAPGQFVEVAGRQMHVICQGQGEVTLVLLAGFGGGALDWGPVMPHLAERTRVCAFDRFGQDYSDPAPHPRTFATAADELNLALKQLRIERPVLVGHSLGGALAQLYADRYEVRGLVLVEALTAADVDAVAPRLGTYRSLDFLAPTGLLRPIGGLMLPKVFEPAVRAQMVALRSGAQALLSLTDEGAVAAATAGAELRAAEERLAVPLLLIGAERSDVPGLPVGRFAASLEALAGRKAGSVYVQVPGAGHYVQAEQPEAVVAAILGWLERGVGR